MIATAVQQLPSARQDTDRTLRNSKTQGHKSSDDAVQLSFTRVSNTSAYSHQLVKSVKLLSKWGRTSVEWRSQKNHDTHI